MRQRPLSDLYDGKQRYEESFHEVLRREVYGRSDPCGLEEKAALPTAGCRIGEWAHSPGVRRVER